MVMTDNYFDSDDSACGDAFESEANDDDKG